MGEGWVSDGDPPYRKRLGIRKLGSCAACCLVIPTEGRDLWEAEQVGIGKEQGRALFHPQTNSTTHRSFQDDKARVITDYWQAYSITNQIPPCGRDDKSRDGIDR